MLRVLKYVVITPSFWQLYLIGTVLTSDDKNPRSLQRVSNSWYAGIVKLTLQQHRPATMPYNTFSVPF